MIPDLSELTAELNRMASKVTMPSGSLVFRGGDPVSGVFLVRKGALSLSLEPDENPLFPPKILRPGEIAGLPAALTGTYSLSAHAIEDAELGFVPVQRVADLLESSPRLCLLATRLMSDEIARMRAALKETPHLHAAE